MFYLYKITNIKHKLFVTNRRWFQHTGDIPGNCCCFLSLQWRHNESDGVPNHEPHDCLLNHLFRRRSNKASKLCVTGLCVGNSPVTGEFHAQMASNAENVSIWWRHHVSIFFNNDVALLTGLHHIPADTWSNDKSHYYVKTTLRCRFDLIMTSLRHVSAGPRKKYIEILPSGHQQAWSVRRKQIGLTRIYFSKLLHVINHKICEMKIQIIFFFKTIKPVKDQSWLSIIITICHRL